MPHVRRSMLIWIDADTEHVEHALVDDLAMTTDGNVSGVAVLYSGGQFSSSAASPSP